MAKASSIAPKERINVTFKPAIGNAVEEIELPLKVMVMGDFLNRHDPRPILDRKPVSINKNNFGEVMDKQGLSLQIAVPNRLRDGAEDTDINVDLKFSSMKDFEPENIARQVPEMAKLLSVREALVTIKGPLGNVTTFREAIETALTDEKQRVQMMRELGLTAADLENLQAATQTDEGSVKPQSDSAETEAQAGGSDTTGDKPKK
jgi:type VI secretion protein, VC_A0107 family